MSTNWEICIFENNRKLACYTLIHRQTVKDAERYNLDLVGNEMLAMIQAVESGAYLLTVVTRVAKMKPFRARERESVAVGAFRGPAEAA